MDAQKGMHEYMNKVILIGRLVRDVETRYTQGENPMTVSRYTLAVDRRFKQKGEEQKADFINCIAFGKNGDFAGKYLKKGTKIAIVGHIQTGSYTNKEGNKVYTTDVIVDEQEFCESKGSQQEQPKPMPKDADGFTYIPEGIDAEIPFI